MTLEEKLSPETRAGRSRYRLRLLALAFLKVALVLILTLIVAEAFFQFALLRLPPALIYALPQYPMRLGITSDATTGARHFPAGQLVERTLDGRTGDLYALSCLTPPADPLFEPYTVRFVRDAWGFRNPANLPSQVDLVILGDSFAEAESVQQPFWNGLAPTVFNLGLPDSGTLEQLALLKRHGLVREPNTVVLAYFGGNDLQNNLDFAALRATDQTYESRAWAEPAIAFLITPRLVAFLTMPPRDCPYPVQSRDGTALAFYDPFLLNAMVAPDRLRESPEWRITEAALREMGILLRTSGIRFVVAYIPFKAQVYRAALDDETLAELRGRLVPSPTPADEQALSLSAFDAQQTLLAALADKAGFEFVDLTPAFRLAAARGDHLYFYGDTHWNQNGHDLAHDQIAAALSSAR